MGNRKMNGRRYYSIKKGLEAIYLDMAISEMCFGKSMCSAYSELMRKDITREEWAELYARTEEVRYENRQRHLEMLRPELAKAKAANSMHVGLLERIIKLLQN